MAISNVMAYAEDIQKPSRVGFKVLEGGRKVRFLKKSPEEVLDKA